MNRHRVHRFDFIIAPPPATSDVGCIVPMITEQTRAIKILTLLGAVFLSIAVPILMVSCDVGGEVTLAIFAPGLLLMSPVHNFLPALIVTVVVNAIVYCAVAYVIVWSVLRIMETKRHP